MRLATDHVGVKVCASSANLGPGFDCLGLALARYDHLQVRALAGAGVRVRVAGEGAGTLPGGSDHLVVAAMTRALEHVGAPLMGFELTCTNTIPHGRGLGSSAAAVVAGIVAARTMIADPEALNNQVALQIATQMEGHPDNAAAALAGGATIAWMREGGAYATGFGVHRLLEPIVLLPSNAVMTRRARAALPTHIPHEDGAHAAGRAALLVHALRDDLSLLWEATADRLHQNYRGEVMPQSVQLVQQLRAQGLAAVISGAGPSVLVLSTQERADADVQVCQQVATSGHWCMLKPGIASTGAQGEMLA